MTPDLCLPIKTGKTVFLYSQHYSDRNIQTFIINNIKSSYALFLWSLPLQFCGFLKDLGSGFQGAWVQVLTLLFTNTVTLGGKLHLPDIHYYLNILQGC